MEQYLLDLGGIGVTVLGAGYIIRMLYTQNQALHAKIYEIQNQYHEAYRDEVEKNNNRFLSLVTTVNELLERVVAGNNSIIEQLEMQKYVAETIQTIAQKQKENES